jgi:hypothetical protein
VVLSRLHIFPHPSMGAFRVHPGSRSDFRAPASVFPAPLLRLTERRLPVRIGASLGTCPAADLVNPVIHLMEGSLLDGRCLCCPLCSSL